ncbi:MAG: hypothetical protein ACK5IC_08675 [Moheibacter sp.]
MGTRLIMHNLIVILLLLTLVGCSSSKRSIYQSKENFIQAYKISVYYGCVNTATSGNFQRFSSDNNDLGLAPQVAVIYHAEVEQAQELGKRLSSRINTINYSDYQGKKPILSDCANFAFYSNEVDSIAKVTYNTMKNAKPEYNYEN